MPRIFINLEAGCLQVNLMSTSAQINQLKYTILYYTKKFVFVGDDSHRIKLFLFFEEDSQRIQFFVFFGGDSWQINIFFIRGPFFKNKKIFIRRGRFRRIK